MALRSALLWLLVLVSVALQKSCFGSSSHSLRYFLIAISDPNQGLPNFFSLGYVDDQVVIYYDSNSRRVKPRVSWMDKMEEEEQYWQTQTEMFRTLEHGFRSTIHSMTRFKDEREELHIVQAILSCDIQEDGSKGGFWHYAIKGSTFWTIDKGTATWESERASPQIKQLVEENCIQWLEKYLSYGKEMLLKIEPPVVTVSRRTKTEDGMEMYVCRVHGFYPKKINVSWTRDGEVCLQDTFQSFYHKTFNASWMRDNEIWLQQSTLNGSVAPNTDETYYYRLSISIDPKERDHYQCHVEHDSLQGPLIKGLNEPTNPKSNLGLIIGCVVVAALVLGCLIAGIFVFLRRNQVILQPPRSTSGRSQHEERGKEKGSTFF